MPAENAIDAHGRRHGRRDGQVRSRRPWHPRTARSGPLMEASIKMTEQVEAA
jgi:hypothetical protein